MITITVDDISDPNIEKNLFPIILDENDEDARVFMKSLIDNGMLNDNGEQKLNEVGIT